MLLAIIRSNGWGFAAAPSASLHLSCGWGWRVSQHCTGKAHESTVARENIPQYSQWLFITYRLETIDNRTVWLTITNLTFELIISNHWFYLIHPNRRLYKNIRQLHEVVLLLVHIKCESGCIYNFCNGCRLSYYYMIVCVCVCLQ